MNIFFMKCGIYFNSLYSTEKHQFMPHVRKYTDEAEMGKLHTDTKKKL